MHYVFKVYADGLRNEVGLAFDDAGILWGVENAGGADYLIRDDLGGNIHDGTAYKSKSSATFTSYIFNRKPRRRVE